MNTFPFSLKFTREQRSGIFSLLFLMLLLQLLYFLYFSDSFDSGSHRSEKEVEWLAMQTQIDSLKSVSNESSKKMYPFNPNFISDYKGYVLGMSVVEIDRLHAFRKENKFVNSADEFQKVTKVSNKLLAAISPFFKFPDWVKNKNKAGFHHDYSNSFGSKTEKIVVKDINAATQEELMKVYGIGPALSERILKEREKVGAFVSMEQLNDVWGLEQNVIENINKHFKILVKPIIKKLQINTASVKEMTQLPFFRYTLAKEIVTFRSMNGDIKGKDDLLKIKNFPVDKVDIIALYLDF